jgi:valyl-tRNA synthetase
MIGRKAILPIMNKQIPIIADDYIDIETGTGALKVTPAHAQADFEIAQRNELPMPSVIDSEGRMTGDIPERFKGMDTIECSKAIVKELEELGLLQKMEKIKHEVAVCERCETPIQPILSYQWFLKTDDLAQKALESIRSGETEILPEGQKRALINFYQNIEPWCISRQLWWGHRIPIWYSGSKELHDWLLENTGKTAEDYEKATGKKANGDGRAIFGEEKPYGEGEFEQETDVLDTWFSSGQWPFSTTMAIEGFHKYYPTDNMVHDKGIVFFWSGRMMMLAHYRTGKAPFKSIFVHGTILAADGQKMSKSKGNGVSPIYLFDTYGADALRMWYYTDVLAGSNAPFREEKMKGHRNFVNKIWNASRFVMMNIDESEIEGIREKMNSLHGARLDQNHENMEKIKNYLEKKQFNLGAEQIREFFWHEYCDKWIEQIKSEIKDESIGSEKRTELLAELIFLLKENMKIMHPFMPYITEAVWQELGKIGLAEGFLMAQQI